MRLRRLLHLLCCGCGRKRILLGGLLKEKGWDRGQEWGQGQGQDQDQDRGWDQAS